MERALETHSFDERMERLADERSKDAVEVERREAGDARDVIEL